MVEGRHHTVVLEVLLDGAAHHDLGWASGTWLSPSSHLLIIYPLAVDEVLVFARWVVLMVHLPDINVNKLKQNTQIVMRVNPPYVS